MTAAYPEWKVQELSISYSPAAGEPAQRVAAEPLYVVAHGPTQRSLLVSIFGFQGEDSRISRLAVLHFEWLADSWRLVRRTDHLAELGRWGTGAGERVLGLGALDGGELLMVGSGWAGQGYDIRWGELIRVGPTEARKIEWQNEARMFSAQHTALAFNCADALELSGPQELRLESEEPSIHDEDACREVSSQWSLKRLDGGQLELTAVQTVRRVRAAVLSESWDEHGFGQGSYRLSVQARKASMRWRFNPKHMRFDYRQGRDLTFGA